jgi:hypothetical protein
LRNTAGTHCSIGVSAVFSYPAFSPRVDTFQARGYEKDKRDGAAVERYGHVAESAEIHRSYVEKYFNGEEIVESNAAEPYHGCPVDHAAAHAQPPSRITMNEGLTIFRLNRRLLSIS